MRIISRPSRFYTFSKRNTAAPHTFLSRGGSRVAIPYGSCSANNTSNQRIPPCHTSTERNNISFLKVSDRLARRFSYGPSGPTARCRITRRPLHKMWRFSGNFSHSVQHFVRYLYEIVFSTVYWQMNNIIKLIFFFFKLLYYVRAQTILDLKLWHTVYITDKFITL